jgi:hypothetical protein
MSAEQPHRHRAEPRDQRCTGAGKKQDEYRAQNLFRRVALLIRMIDAFGIAGILARALSPTPRTELVELDPI